MFMTDWGLIVYIKIIFQRGKKTVSLHPQSKHRKMIVCRNISLMFNILSPIALAGITEQICVLP